MFGRMMNNFYYGKSGKGDFRKEDMPETRWQLFWDTLRTRLSGLCRLNLLYMLVFLPMMVVLAMNFFNIIQGANMILAARDGNLSEYLQANAEEGQTVTLTEEQEKSLAEADLGSLLDSTIFRMLIWLIPCIAITGPFTAGLCYVTRNWARDEHAFIWSDFKDAVKENWKQSLLLSCITSVLPLLCYVGWRFYGNLARTNTLMVVPQVLVLMIGVIWSLCITYMHPMAVSYELRFRDLLRNGLLLGVARLPMSIGIRLLHCVPTVIAVVLAFFWNPMYAVLFLGVWYVIIGFSLSRFITASYTNAVFDKYINSRMEGVKVNRGLRDPEDEDDGEDEEENAAEGNGEA